MRPSAGKHTAAARLFEGEGGARTIEQLFARDRCAGRDTRTSAPRRYWARCTITPKRLRQAFEGGCPDQCAVFCLPMRDRYRALMLEGYERHPDAFTSSAAERAAFPMAWWESRLDVSPLAARWCSVPSTAPRS